MNGSLTLITDPTNPSFRTEENTTAYRYNMAYKDAIAQGVSFDTLAKYGAASDYVNYFTGGDTVLLGPPESAYDYFIKNENDCTSIAYATQAVYDTLGYNTAVVHSPNESHDYIIIELDGHWYRAESSLKTFDKDSVLKNDFIKFAPSVNAGSLNFIKITNQK